MKTLHAVNPNAGKDRGRVHATVNGPLVKSRVRHVLYPRCTWENRHGITNLHATQYVADTAYKATQTSLHQRSPNVQHGMSYATRRIDNGGRKRRNKLQGGGEEGERREGGIAPPTGTPN